MAESDFAGILPNAARCLYSRWTGYLEQPEWKTTKAKLVELGGDLIEVHTSGHIYADDIIDLVGQIAPKTLIPLHTFEPQVFSQHFANVTLLRDGEAMQLV